MRKLKTIAVLLGIMFLLISLSAVSSAVPSSSQASVYRFDAKGGIPGPPDKPNPPDDEEPPAIEYELVIEIDYISSHEPTDAVLTYINDYYYDRGIDITFYFEDITLAVIGLGINYDDGINGDEFWAIEAEFNDEKEYNDRLIATEKGEYVSGEGLYVYDTTPFYLKEKWVLFGSTVEGQSSTMGYTYVITSPINPKKADMLVGNYIFIADEGADDWAIDNDIEPYGAEAVVLMHEIGHSIGIGVVEWNVFYGWVEVYDRDTYSIMSTLNPDNAGSYDQWYYSGKYWNTKNMEYYTT